MGNFFGRRNECPAVPMVGNQSSWVVTLMHALKLQQTMGSLGEKRMNPGVTMADVGGLCLYPSILTERGEKTDCLLGHFGKCCRFIVVADVSELMADGAASQEALLHRANHIVDTAFPDSAEWRLLVVATKSDQPADALERVRTLEGLFSSFGARFKEVLVTEIGMNDHPSKMAADLAWLERPF
jgi:hypothetical protein